MQLFRNRTFLIWGLAVPLLLVFLIEMDGGKPESGANAVGSLLF